MPIENFKKAQKNYENNNRKIKNTIKILTEASRALEDINHVSIANATFGSAENTLTPSKGNIDKNTFPTIEEIGKLIDNYHQYKSELGQSYSALSNSDKKIIPEPYYNL